MGIPSYFSHVVRRHREIIQRYVKKQIKVDNLYLDSNSIIYDAVHALDNQDSVDFEERLIQAVCKKIAFYIHKICPSQRVIIAFDGVAPIAKLNQQRTRRYKSWFQEKVCAGASGDACIKEKWNTASITPGTLFMEKMGKAITKTFANPKEYGLNVLIVSSSNEAGEGEHKIYKYIRDNAEYHRETTTVIYGLDADLIMLSLNHIQYAKQMYLHRETPEFIKSIDSTLDTESDYLLCINSMHKRVVDDINVVGANVVGANVVGANVIGYGASTYVFMCFLLGNDFLPHFPALNIRTNGLDRLMNAHKHVFQNKNGDFFVKCNDLKCNDLNWKNIRIWIEHLSKNEHEYIKEEYELRGKYRVNNYKRNNSQQTQKQTNEKQSPSDILLDFPMREREIETYINPNEKGWESRYYKTLFDIEIDDTRRKEICINYLEGLEWTMKYYTSGCPDWEWHYKYDYPPLLCDLIKYVPYFDTTFITTKPSSPVSPYVQLSYVLPRSSMNLLPDTIHRALLKTHPEWYGNNYPLVWAFCKYIWEAHVKLPEINIKELGQIIGGCNVRI
jgi:5'-3' exoribonuclease 2